MKVLIYTNAFAPEIGGIETVVMSLAQGLATTHETHHEDRLEVTVVTATPSNDFDDRLLDFKVVRQPNWLQFVHLIHDSDIVHLSGPTLLPTVLALLLRKRVVVEHHGFQTVCPNGQLMQGTNQRPCPGHFMAARHFECFRCNAKEGWFRSFKRWLLTFPRRWLCHFVSVNITPTNWLATVLDLPRMTTVYHGVQDMAAVRSVGALKLPLSFAFLGRLVSTKGVRILLLAAHKLKQQRRRSVRFNIIGKGPERAALEAEAEALNLGDCVSFLGSLPSPAVDRLLSDASAIVMPSLGGEVFGLVAAENMLRGRVLVVSDTGALREVVGDAGLVFPVGDTDGLASCLAKIMDNPELLPKLGQKARERGMQLFRTEPMVEAHLKVYTELLK